jgi:hypothetical protein
MRKGACLLPPPFFLEIPEKELCILLASTAVRVIVP